MIYRSQTMDIVSYSNGTPAYSMALSNDSDVIAISANTGAPLGDLPSITAQTFYGNEEKTDGEVTISAIGCEPATLSGRTYQMKSLGEANTGSITFTWKPNGAGATPVLTKIFTFNVITSNVDYDLIIPQTLFNTKSNNITVSVNVLKKAEGSAATTIAPNGDNNIIVQYKQANKNSWTSIKSSSVEIEDVTTSYTFRIIKAVDENEENPFVWDSETVEFVSDGAAERDFNITASSYVLVKNADGILKGSTITLTAHPINLPYGSDSIQWYKDDVPVSGKIGLTYKEIDEIGKYTAKVLNADNEETEWQDSVVIGETQDGATGKDAISITLSNPTMTFHKNTSQAPEFCQVIVYEGGIELNPVEYDSTTQKLKGRGFCIQSPSNCNIVENKDGVEVSDQDSNGAATFTVLIQASGGIETSRDFTINWVVVENGNDSTIPGPSTTANTQYVYLKTNAQAVDTPTNGTNPEDDSNGWSSNDIDGDPDGRYVYKAEVTTIIQTNNGTETSRNYKWSAPMLYKAYNDKGQTQTSYADYLRLTSFGTATNYYYDNNGELIIQANTLAVGEEGAHKFYASEQADEVTIGGWSVGEHSIYQQISEKELIIYKRNEGWLESIYQIQDNKYVDFDPTIDGLENNVQYYLKTSNDLYMPIIHYYGFSDEGQKVLVYADQVGNNLNAYYTAFINSLGTGLQEPNSGDVAISVGYTNPNDWTTGNFYVTHNGSIYAKEGIIAGWSITEDGLKKEYEDGKDTYEVMINGRLNTTENEQDVWHTTCFEVRKNYEDSLFYVRPTGFLHSEYGEIGGWTINSTNISKTAIMPIAKDSPDTHQYWIVISSNLYDETQGIPYNPVFAIQNQSTGQWPFLVRSNGQLSATGVDISGTINAEQGTIGGFTIEENSISSTTGYGVYIKKESLGTSLVDNSLNFLAKEESEWIVAGSITTNRSSEKITITARGDYGWSWSIPSAFVTSSDEKIKTNIASFNDQYDIFFNNLQPRMYQLKDGTSNRQHFGFIAQEVYHSIELASLTTKDVAAYVEFAYNKAKSEEQRELGLRYEEFISLNTWQIQLLKPRMTAAEEKIAQLELEISSLKSELENLKKS